MSIRKKGSEPDLSISILLTTLDSGTHKVLAEKYLQEKYPNHQYIFINDAEENLPINLIRNIIHTTSFARTKKESQIYVLCGIENASIPAQNALLKIIEEPPKNIGFMLVTTQGYPVLPTITSRCREVSPLEINTNDQIENKNQPTDKLKPHIQETISFCNNPQSTNYHELIDLALVWSKSETKEKDLKISMNILMEQSQKNHFALDKLREALDSWEKNGNVKLVIEHCFFVIKKH